jgi:signal transduction histidine kinase
MLIRKLENYFIADQNKSDDYIFYRYKLLLNASIYTSLFSLLYLVVSLIIEFRIGVYYMVFNVAGFLILPFLMKARIGVKTLGNLYVFIGTLAVVILIFYSGGIHSPILPWMIVPSVLALLIVSRFYALVWAGISIGCLTAFILYAMSGYSFPVSYNADWKLLFMLLCSSGIIMIVVTISMIFESNTVNALNEAERQKKALQLSKTELAKRHEEILEKNDILVAQKEELLTQSEQLKELNEKKNYLMEILAHDLKSPLANIQALIGFIKADAFPENSMERKVVDMIVDSSKKSQALIQKILNSENLESIIYNLKLETANISDLVKEAIEDIRETANRKNINIHYVVANNKSLNATVDKIYLKQVYENLLNNAIKFSLPGKHIFVSVNASDRSIRTEVRDEGPGIPKEEMDLLFKKFKKLSNRPTAGESSAGLGLSIVKHYTELLQGKVWCESAPGKGSNFIVELPLHKN